MIMPLFRQQKQTNNKNLGNKRPPSAKTMIMVLTVLAFSMSITTLHAPLKTYLYHEEKFQNSNNQQQQQKEEKDSAAAAAADQIPSTPQPQADNSDGQQQNGEKKFYVHPLPAMSTDLIYNKSNDDGDAVFHQTQNLVDKPELNEDLAEIWLHQGFEHDVDGKTNNPVDADVFIVPAYFYLSYSISNSVSQGNVVSHEQRFDLLISQLNASIDSIVTMKVKGRRENEKEDVLSSARHLNMTHVILSPTTSAPTAIKLGIKKLVQFLKEKVGESNVYSVAIERNRGWAAGTILQNIIVGPYVVKPSVPHDKLTSIAYTTNSRKENFVFYVASTRQHAIEWAGCNRSIVLPLKGESNMKIGLDERIPPETFQQYMLESDYCLITCGDTPTSRRLTDSMVFGCIPIFIGTRLFGECVSPCHKGWGWTVTNGLAHLPFEDQIPWHEFPLVDEAAFAEAPKQVLEGVFLNFTSQRKEELRAIMQKAQFSFLYGWGTPLKPTYFGKATSALWKSIVSAIK